MNTLKSTETIAQVTTKRGSLANGLDAIENYLGLNSGQAAFINEFYNSIGSFPDLSEPTDWVLGDTSACLAPIVMAGRMASLVTLSCPKTLVDYLSANGILPYDPNIISVCNPTEQLSTRLFPEGSVVYQMQENINGLSSALCGKVFVPSFVTPEILAAANTVNGTVLNTVQDSINFNSKSYLRRIAEKEGINMPVGLIIEPNEPIESGVLRFRDMAARNNLPVFPAWLKFPSVAGGGTTPLPNGPDMDFIKSMFVEFIKSANGSYSNPPLARTVTTYSDIPQLMVRDFVLEFDIAARGDVKILGNYCFQGVIGAYGSTYVGTAGQVTENGNYVGGYTLSKDEEEFLEPLLPDIFKVFESFQRRGYRGFIGVDALITETGDRKVKPYILEANCRMNGSTPLLGLVQKLEFMRGCSLYGETMTVPVPAEGGCPEKVMTGILDFFNNAGLLYKTGKDNGIIPLMPDVYPKRPDPNIAQTRCAIVGENYSDVQTIKNTVLDLTRGN